MTQRPALWPGLLAALAAALSTALAGCASGPGPDPAASAMPAVTVAPTPAGVEVVWLGQAAFKITSPTGKVIVTDPWLRTNPLTPAAYRQLEHFGRIDLLLVTHGHFDHVADAPALAQQYNVPVRGPGDLLRWRPSAATSPWTRPTPPGPRAT